MILISNNFLSLYIYHIRKYYINKKMKDAVDKIDLEDLIKDFKILSVDVFSSYLKEVWRVYI